MTERRLAIPAIRARDQSDSPVRMAVGCIDCDTTIALSVRDTPQEVGRLYKMMRKHHDDEPSHGTLFVVYRRPGER